MGLYFEHLFLTHVKCGKQCLETVVDLGFDKCLHLFPFL